MLCAQAAQDPEAGLRAALYTALAPLEEDVQDALEDEHLLGPDLLARVWGAPRIVCLVWQLAYCPLAGPAWELLAGKDLSLLLRLLRSSSSKSGLPGTAAAPLPPVGSAWELLADFEPRLAHVVCQAPRVGCLVWQLCCCPVAKLAWELPAGEM